MTIHVVDHLLSPKKDHQMRSHNILIDRFLRFVQDLQRDTTAMMMMMPIEPEDPAITTTNTTAAAAAMTTVQYHDSYFHNTPDHHHRVAEHTTRLQSYLHNNDLLTNTNSTWLQLTSDVEFQQYQSYIVTGLIFYFHSVGQWPNHTSTTTTSTTTPTTTTLSIQKGCLGTALQIDRTAAQAIHLFPPQNHVGQESYLGGRKHTNSIYGVFQQHCYTKGGKQLLSHWLQQPLIDLAAIRKRQSAVALFVQHSLSRDRVRTQGLQLFANCHLHQIATTLSYYASLVEEPATDRNGGGNDEDGVDGGTRHHKKANPKRSNGPGWNTRKALMAMYQLYLISSQKLPLLSEQLQLTISSSSESEESSDLVIELSESLRQCVMELERSVQLIEAVIDLDRAPREFLVQTEYKNELSDIAQELNDVQAQIQAHHEEMNQLWCDVSNTTNDGAVRLETIQSSSNNNNSSSHSMDDGDQNHGNGDSGTSISGYQFRLINTNDSKILQTELKNQVTVHKILKNGVYFSTKTLRQLSQQINDLHTEYDKYQKQVVQDAIQVAATYAAVLHRAADAIGHLDVLVALAQTAAYSTTGPYCRPVLTDCDDNGRHENGDPKVGIILQQARHPCVELQESIDFIPNDYNLIFDESSFLIVTGPNSTWWLPFDVDAHVPLLYLYSLFFLVSRCLQTVGGKSTYIRAVGAIVTMAQIGSFVPCTSATINICQYVTIESGHLLMVCFVRNNTRISLTFFIFDSHILARVGAGDQQDRGISTFMAEMLESSSILRTATKRSLIIIDELGRGTSTFDGYGLAKAISEYIVQSIGCITLFATHFHELTVLEEQEKAVKNCHVTAQKGNHGLTFLYEIQPGPCLESFGIQVAEMANVPHTVIQDAKRRARLLENFEYRHQKLRRVSSSDQDNEDDQGENDAEAQKFINRFCSLPIAEIVRSNQYANDDERKNALLQLLSEA